MSSLKRQKRNLDMIARGELTKVADDDDGNPIYEHPTGNGLVLHTGHMIGNGRRAEYGTVDAIEEAAAQRAAQSAKKEAALTKYEEELTESLRAVSLLQRKAVEVGVSDGVVLSPADIQKMKLGLQAAESILNRLVGRPKQMSEVRVEGSVIDEMTKIVDEWVIDGSNVEEIDD